MFPEEMVSLGPIESVILNTLIRSTLNPIINCNAKLVSVIGHNLTDLILVQLSVLIPSICLLELRLQETIAMYYFTTINHSHDLLRKNPGYSK